MRNVNYIINMAIFLTILNYSTSKQNSLNINTKPTKTKAPFYTNRLSINLEFSNLATPI